MSMTRTHPASNVSSARSATNVLVARQPILDRHSNLHAWELLYRSSAEGPAGVVDGDHATASVVTSSFLDIGLERLLEGRPGFINATREFIVSGAALALPALSVVLEILEDVEADDELVAAVGVLRDRGYCIALDDFFYDDSLRPLLELAHLVKVDVLALSPEQVRDHVEILERYDVELLAEKVETQSQYQELRDMGFTLFQGYFFARPEIVEGSRLSGSRVAVMRLLAGVHDPAVDIDALADLVTQDPAISFRIMRFINSPAVGLPSSVTSVQRAVVYMGLTELKRWLSLIALSSMDDKPTALTRLTLTRARMCELLASLTGRCDQSLAFTVGLFSTLDAFMDRPLDEMLAELPLSSEAIEALVDHSGPAGEALTCALAYEEGDWDAALANAAGQSPEKLSKVYSEAVQWADSVSMAAIS